MIRHGTYEDIPQLKALWKQAFGDEDEYRDDFFTRVFRPDYTLCQVSDGIVTAMLYMLPCTVSIDKKVENAWYFYALATERGWRGNGIMGDLIGAAKEEVFARGNKLIFLIPAEQSLVEYYRRFQFQPIDKIPGFYLKSMLGESDKKILLSTTDRREAAALMSRRWEYTNCNVSFPKEIENFCLEWALAEKDAVFYKIISSGEIIGYFQGHRKKGVFHINYYGMTRPCWKEAGAAASREGLAGMCILAFENPDKTSFSDMDDFPDKGDSPAAAVSPDTAGDDRPIISVCTQQKVRKIHGIIPI